MVYRSLFKTILCTRAYFSRDVCLHDIFLLLVWLFTGSLNVCEIFLGSGRVHEFLSGANVPACFFF